MKTRYTFDPNKANENLEKHGVDFAAAEGFDWQTAKIVADERYDYGEDRYVAYGKIGSKLHVLVFTPRSGTVRIISLREANKREIEAYEKS